MTAPDITIRPAVPEDAIGIATAHVATWRTQYAGIVPAAHLAGLSVEARAEAWRERLADTSAKAAGVGIFVAQSAGGEVTGFASCGARRDGDAGFAGEIYGLYVLAGSQRRGLGRRLVRAAATHLATHAMPSLLLWVLAANPSRGFYERLGGKLLGTQLIHIGDADLEEVAYGWEDTTALRLP
ncbi:MAG TPA: GNAT family N-acetyltransferase [Ktedonobacterales bacterium]